MANIEQAIKKEKEYLEHRMRNEEPFHLVDAVRDCGFDTLEDYFKNKRDYEFGHLDFSIIETSSLEAISEVLLTIRSKKTAVLFADTEFTLVWNGTGSVFNKEYCDSHGIPVLPLQTAGGTIVSTSGDLNIGICTPQLQGIDEAFLLNGLANIFRKYTDKNVEVDGNDILVDGYKVLGSSSYRAFGMLMLITPVSMTEKTKFINKICVKKSLKTPSYIDFMTSKELREEVQDWLKAHFT